MSVVKSIKLAYIVLTTFVFSTIFVLNINFFNILPGIVIMWVYFLIFKIGACSANNTLDNKKVIINQSHSKDILDFISNKRMLILLCTTICSVSISYFYTGHTPLDVFRSLINHESLYLDYQQYHKENNIGTFSFSKIPYILMNALLNLLFCISVINTVILRKKVHIKDCLYLILISLVFIYFGFARGTNFEIFEVICLFFFAIRYRFDDRNIKIPLKIKNASIIIVIVSLFIFSASIENRNGTTGKYITSEIRFDNSKVLSKLFPSSALLISKLSLYLGFGFYFVGTLFNTILIEKMELILSSVIPFTNQLIGVNLVSEVQNYMDCGTNWRPDIVWLLSSFGFIGSAIIFYWLGIQTVSLSYTNTGTILEYLLKYYIFLQMISFPIGNFIRISSANKLIVLGCLVLLVMKRIKVRKDYKNQMLDN